MRALLIDGLLEAAGVSEDPVELVPLRSPNTDDASLRSYWFRPTEEGRQVWREGHDLLDKYFDEHPIDDT